MKQDDRPPLASWRDYLRPWKLFSLACGIGILLVGGRLFPAPDWDVGISLLMAVCTYVFAPMSGRILFRRRWAWLPLALFGAWWSVDGVYWAYWAWRDPAALAAMRSANWPTSTCLYLICACLWLHDGPLREMLPRRARCRHAEEGL